MAVSKIQASSTDFNFIEQNLIIHSKLAGLDTFPNIKWHRWQIIYKYATHCMYGAGMINMSTLAWKFRDHPFEMLIVGSFCFDVGSFMIPGLTVFWHKTDYLDLLDWCKQKTRAIEMTMVTTNCELQSIAHRHANIALMDSKRIIKIVQQFSLFLFFVAMVVVTIVGAFLPDDIYGKFKLPLSYYLIFVKPCNWIGYIINYIQQIWAAVHYLSFGVYYFSIFFTICRYIVAHFDSMIEFVKVMKIKMERNDEDFSFEAWTKLVYKQHVEINE